MNIRELRNMLGDTQHEFSERYNIPFRTIQNWEGGVRIPAEYIITYLNEKVRKDICNHRTYKLPVYNKNKKNLPNRADYLGSVEWLQNVNKVISKIDSSCVFALDDALMCLNTFTGHNTEDLIWVYGDDSLKKFNGVIVLGNQINSMDVINVNGIKCTTFNRTLIDSFDNEDILDMQGITIALSKYYFTHNNSFEGIIIPPEYQMRFSTLSADSIEYYDL